MKKILVVFFIAINVVGYAEDRKKRINCWQKVLHIYCDGWRYNVIIPVEQIYAKILFGNRITSWRRDKESLQSPYSSDSEK